MTRSIILFDREVSYELTRKKVKNINLRIYPDGKVKVSARQSVPIELIERFMRERASFILKALDRFESRERTTFPKNNFNDNDSVRIFDEILTLKVLNDKKNHVERRGGELLLFVRDEGDRSLKEKTLDAYLKTVLLSKIDEIFPTAYSHFSTFGFDRPEIKIRKMRSRWGSCNATKGIVTLSLALASHPPECLRFVIMHELCHLVHPNHSKAFYQLLDAVMPEWKKIKSMLNSK